MSMSVAVPLKTVKEEKGKKEDGERRKRRRERGGERTSTVGWINKVSCGHTVGSSRNK